MNNKYKRLAKWYLSQARRNLKEGNYLQACEKYWLSVAETVKAYANSNKLKHDRHDRLFKIIDKIGEKTKDDELIKGFNWASYLHVNAYEDFLTVYQIKLISKEVEKFINKMSNYE